MVLSGWLYFPTSSHLCAIKWRTLKINELSAENGVTQCNAEGNIIFNHPPSSLVEPPTLRRAAHAMSKMLELTLG